MCLVSFTQHNVFKVHPRCCIYQYLIPFNCRMIFLCMGISHFIYSLINLCFHISYMGNATINIHVQVFVWMYVFISLGHILKCKIAKS